MSEQLTLDPILDRPRLKTLSGKVLAAMQAGGWMTLYEIRSMCGAGSEAGISARIRELHNKYGYEYSKRRRGETKRGVWEYRLTGETT